MESEKLEDLLLLSLSATKGQRERSEVLDVGVTRDKNLREVIVKYSGDIDGLQIPGMEIQKLLAGYAIVKLPEDQIGALVAAREIEYVEMPKNLRPVCMMRSVSAVFCRFFRRGMRAHPWMEKAC